MDEERIRKVIKNIYNESLGCKEGERLLIFTDQLWLNETPSNPVIFKIFKAVAEDVGMETKEYVYQDAGRHGAEPPEEFWSHVFGQKFVTALNFKQVREKEISVGELLDLKNLINHSHLPDVVIALSYYSTSHTNFRKFINALNTRYASIPNLEERMFYSGLDVDFCDLEKDTERVRSDIEKFSSVFITSGNGTEIYLEFLGRKVLADTGNLRSNGSFGNLPAGEVYVAPLEDKTNGKFVVEYGLCKKLDPPLEIYIERGKVTKMKGNEEMKAYLSRIFDENDKNAIVAELGIGTNKKAKDVFNVLEAEKIYNTCHLALGDNSTFGGENIATAHIDFVIFNPELRWR